MSSKNIFHYSSFIIYLFGLPDFDSVFWFSIKFVPFLDIESLVPSIYIGQRREGTEVVRRMRVCFYLIREVLVGSKRTPYGSSSDEEAFILSETADLLYFSMVF